MALITTTGITTSQVGGVLRQKQNGIITPQDGAYTALAFVNATIYGFRHYQYQAMTLSKITFNITTLATNNDAFDFAIFDATGLIEKLRITAKAGLLNSTGIKTLSAPADFTAITLAADTVYLVAFAAANTGGSPAIWGRSLGSGNVAAMLGTTLTDLLVWSKVTNYPIPTDLSGITSSNVSAVSPVFGFRDA